MSTTDESRGAAENPKLSRSSRRRQRQAQRRRRVTVVVAVVAILAGLGVGANIGWFYLHSATVGGALKAQFRHAVAKEQKSHASCPPLSDNGSGPQGLVEASAIGLSAPVMGGDGDSVLDVAVGHVPGSAWPGEPGTTLLAAHDVTYFSQIYKLNKGQVVDFATPCTTYLYSVTDHQIVSSGSPMYSSSSQSLLVLETCYPLNALFLTSQRYLVTAVLERVVPKGTTVPPVLAVPPSPGVPAPAPLAAQGLTLATNDVQLGLLNLEGAPSASWQQSPIPLSDEAAALADYFAGLRSAEQDQPAWWSALAPSVPFADSQPLRRSYMTYDGSLTPTLDVDGATLTGAAIDVGVRISGGTDPGRYALHVQEIDVNGSLVITQWTMNPED